MNLLSFKFLKFKLLCIIYYWYINLETRKIEWHLGTFFCEFFWEILPMCLNEDDRPRPLVEQNLSPNYSLDHILSLYLNIVVFDTSRLVVRFELVLFGDHFLVVQINVYLTGCDLSANFLQKNNRFLQVNHFAAH